MKKGLISLLICILVSFMYGHFVFLRFLDIKLVFLSDYTAGLLFSILFLLPFILIIGIPTYIAINAVMKYISKHKYIFEILLYIICGIVGAAAGVLLFSFQDLSKVETLWKPFIILSLSCAIPFGATSILLKNIRRSKEAT
ncbi:hypothetical protein LAV82_22615 [Bacillus sp. ILBB4]|nr:hypothetical protein [Bacillus sp. ILBB4]